MKKYETFDLTPPGCGLTDVQKLTAARSMLWDAISFSGAAHAMIAQTGGDAAKAANAYSVLVDALSDLSKELTKMEGAQNKAEGSKN